MTQTALATTDALTPRPRPTHAVVHRALAERNLDSPERPPLNLTDETAKTLRNAVLIYNERLLPCSKTWLLAEVTKLRSHYWLNAQASQVEKQLMRDWVNDLSQFPAWALLRAFTRWRQDETKTPRIAEIIAIVRDLISTDIRQRNQLETVLAVATVATHGGSGAGSETPEDIAEQKRPKTPDEIAAIAKLVQENADYLTGKTSTKPTLPTF